MSCSDDEDLSSSSLGTQRMPPLLGGVTASSRSSSSSSSSSSSPGFTAQDSSTPPAPLVRLNLNLATDGLLPPEDIDKVYDESAMSREEKRRLLMSVYKYAKPTSFGEDSLKTVRRICNEHIVRKLKFIPSEFLNDMTKNQKQKALAFGGVYQPDFSDSSPSLWNDILNRMPTCTSMTLQGKAVTWMGILPTVKNTIRAYRNNVQSKIKGRASMKGSLIDALKTISKEGFEVTYSGDDLNLLLGLKTIQTLAEGFREVNLMKIRDKRSNDVFRAFVHYFLQHTIPKNDWVSSRSSELISKTFTPVDEAFAILLIINHWQEWKHVAEGNVIDRRRKLTLYTQCYREEGNHCPPLEDRLPPTTIVLSNTTNNRRTRNTNLSTTSSESAAVVVDGLSTGTASTSVASIASTSSSSTDNRKKTKVKGWSTAGLRKFTEICRHIVAIRNKTEQETMEKALLEEYKKMDDGDEGNARKRRRTEHALDELEEEPFNMYGSI